MTHTLSDKALLIALNTTEINVPEWVELLPPGPVIKGRDGRAWRLDNPEAVVAAFGAARPLPFDFEHSTEIAAPKGDPAPASGWIVEMEIRDGGAIWGRVEWTERATTHIAAREYRYVSPVFVYDDTGQIIYLCSAALTNTPNLPLKALNRKEETMSLASIAAALGLPATAQEADILAGIFNLKTDKALNAAQEPPLEKYVPRADFDAAELRARNAESSLAELHAKALADQTEAAITGALDARKIAPAQTDYYRARCKSEADLEEFKRFVASSPALVADAAAPPGENAKAADTLTEMEKATCRRLGLTEDEFLKTRGSE